MKIETQTGERFFKDFTDRWNDVHFGYHLNELPSNVLSLSILYMSNQ